MTLRTLFSFSLTASVFLTFAYGESKPNTSEAEQPNAAVAKQKNEAIPPKPDQGRKTPPVKEIESLLPFVLNGAFDDYPAIPATEVRLFDGENAFRKFVDDGDLTVWPIGEFKSAVWPKDEPGFRQVMRNNAAEIGADYVVIYTDPIEIKRVFQWRLQEQFFCAQVFKKVKARIGILRDEKETRQNITKVSGFLKGSRAEANGLRIGDIVKRVDGEVPGGDDSYWNKALRWKVGDKIKVEIEREGKPMELEIELVSG